MRFLNSAARMYRFDFTDQLLIYAQRPTATACATLEVWNQKMNRWVNRGAKGIALIDDTVQPAKLRYVFDVRDTHAVFKGEEPYIWKMTGRHDRQIIDHLTQTYGLNEAESLKDTLRQLAQLMTDEYLDDAMDGLEQEMNGSRLANLEPAARRETFRTVMQSSIYYVTARRCGLDAERMIPESDFAGIRYFNRIGVLSLMGNALSALNESILMDIGREVRSIDRVNFQKPLVKDELIVYNDFNVVKRESEGTEQGGQEDGTEVSSQGRLPVSESGDRKRSSASDREIRSDAQDVPEREPDELVQEHAALRKTGSAPDGDRPDGAGESRTDSEPVAEDEPGPGQGDEPDGLGSAHEQPYDDGGRDRSEGIGIQLSQPDDGDELTEAEAEMASALSLPETPSVEQQIAEIQFRVLGPLGLESPVPDAVIDDILRSGGGRRNSTLRLISMNMVEMTEEERLNAVRKEYGNCARGLIIDGKKYAMRTNDQGMQIAPGDSVTGSLMSATLTWEQVSSRLRALMEAGLFAQEGVLEAAPENRLKDYGDAMVYFHREISREIEEPIFQGFELPSGSFDNISAYVQTLLKNPDTLHTIVIRLDALAERVKTEPEIMRSRFYKPDIVAETVRQLERPVQTFHAQPGYIAPSYPAFITGDQIDMILSDNFPYENGRLSVYSHYLRNEDMKERADYLKNLFGTGGRHPAMRHVDGLSIDYDARGIRLTYGSDITVQMKWPEVARRIDLLIRGDRFMTAKDYAAIPEYEAKELAKQIDTFYHKLPEEFTSPFSNVYFTDRWEEIQKQLDNPERVRWLYDNMRDILAATPLDDALYNRRVTILNDMRAFLEGEYTLFPDPKQEVQQLSMETLFTIMEAEQAEYVREGTAKETEENPVQEVPDEAVYETEPQSEQPAAEVIIPAPDRPERRYLVVAYHHFENGFDDKLDYPTLEEAESAARGYVDGTMKEDGFRYDGAAVYDQRERRYLRIFGDYPDEKAHAQISTIEQTEESRDELHVGMTFRIDGREFQIDQIGELTGDVTLMDVTFHEQNGYPIFRVESYENVVGWLHAENDRLTAPEEIAEEAAPADVLPANTQRNNFRITDDDLGVGGPKAKFRMNMDAINLLRQLEEEKRLATPDEQEVLSRYVGWGGLQAAFDRSNTAWAQEYRELEAALTKEEYEAARATTLNAFYTPPAVIRAMYEKLMQMGLRSGNILEPSCGVGNFMGMIPDGLSEANMFGVELDSISGRIARQLYQKNSISVQGFETVDFPDSFFDCVIGNVPFGSYKVSDRRYDRHNFLIHDYFIARAIDLARPGGVVAVITSSGTMDKQNDSVRRYIAERADLLGAVRLPNNAFQKNANTTVVSDILFLQKRESRAVEIPEWVGTKETTDGFELNAYFAVHPEMVLGRLSRQSGRFGEEVTVEPIEGADLGGQLREALRRFEGTIVEAELSDTDLESQPDTIPADPDVRNFSFASIDGAVYYRENSRMVRMNLPQNTANRVLAMIELRNTTQALLQAQLEDGTDAQIEALQRTLDTQYDRFTEQYGLISSTANRRAFSQDSSYCLLASLEILDEEGNLKRKADIFSKRTIRRAEPVLSVDTASEALALSIGEKARVDLPFMAQLCGKSEEEVADDLKGVIFLNPLTEKWETGDEYLSGNVRLKLQMAEQSAQNNPQYAINVEYLKRVQPRDLDASEIEVRLGATWISPDYINDFMREVFHTPFYHIGRAVSTQYAQATGTWNIQGKSVDNRNATVEVNFGTRRVNGYKLLEDALNLRDTKIYDVIHTPDGDQRVLNKKETMLAQQKQEMIRAAFREWIFKDMRRREDLCKTYNELFNSNRPREYDGSHIRFVGMTPEIQLMPHQANAVAHILYGGNTLLAHCVGAGKTFQMIAAGMEAKRLGLSQKNLYVVPNHLTEQWGADFLRLYPGANILVATKKDFEPANRKKFCSRIATGSYDAIIIGHSQFERIPLSRERQIATIQRQIDDITTAMESMSRRRSENFSVKQMERTRKGLQTRLNKLNDQARKDDVVTFEQLGVDRLFVDESHNYKNMFLYTKMQNVAGIQQTDAQKSSDMFMKCQYLDELTGGRGVVFATGTPISNSMVELYTIMRYLQYGTLQRLGLGHFDSWAANFGETVTAIELAPEGTGYRAKTRFARFYNLPELISLFKECADIRTADMLNLPVPKAEFINEVLKPSEIQKEMVASFSERAEQVRGGAVDAKVDNMLRITNDGRKCALDQRLMNELLPDSDTGKVNACVRNAFNVWQDGMEKKTTQLIFCDLSVPRADGGFNVYDDIRSKLIQKGVPAEEIAFIHSANTETQKAELFAKVRAGQVRILLGSTPKLGAGTNIQDRLIALHHLDAPWKPSDLEQQEGRILRQGNSNEQVQIYRYVTEGTFDSYMWQILENKQKFISQIMTSKSPVRACEDVDDTALSYAEIKALATGNPYIKQKMDLDIQVSRLKMMKANHVSQIYQLESDIARNFPSQISAVNERIDNLTADMERAKPILAQDKDHFSMVVSGRTYTERKEAGAALILACTGTKELQREIPVGDYQGFKLLASYNVFANQYELNIRGQGSYTIEMGRDPLGNITRINNLLESLGNRLEDAARKRDTLLEQLEIARREVVRPFPQEQELAEKQARLAELNVLLNMDERRSEAATLDDGASVDEDDARPKQHSREETTPRPGKRRGDPEL